MIMLPYRNECTREGLQVALKDRNHDQRLLLQLRASIQLANFPELCSLPPDQRRDSFEALLSGIQDQIGFLSNAIAQLYFSHEMVSREISGIREEHSS